MIKIIEKVRSLTTDAKKAAEQSDFELVNELLTIRQQLIEQLCDESELKSIDSFLKSILINDKSQISILRSEQEKIKIEQVSLRKSSKAIQHYGSITKFR